MGLAILSNTKKLKQLYPRYTTPSWVFRWECMCWKCIWLTPQATDQKINRPQKLQGSFNMSQPLWRKAGKVPGCQLPWQNYKWLQKITKNECPFGWSTTSKGHISIPKMRSHSRYACEVCGELSAWNKWLMEGDEAGKCVCWFLSDNQHAPQL